MFFGCSLTVINLESAKVVKFSSEPWPPSSAASLCHSHGVSINEANSRSVDARTGENPIDGLQKLHCCQTSFWLSPIISSLNVRALKFFSDQKNNVCGLTSVQKLDITISNKNYVSLGLEHLRATRSMLACSLRNVPFAVVPSCFPSAITSKTSKTSTASWPLSTLAAS